MRMIRTEIKEWGRSLGIVIPKEAVVSEKLHAGETIEIILVKRKRVLEDVFGTMKLKRTTKKILDEIDNEGWDE